MEKSQKWLNKFISDSQRRELVSDTMSIEESMFSVFTEAIETSDQIPNIIYQRYKGRISNKEWEIWGVQKSADNDIIEYNLFICNFSKDTNVQNELKSNIDSNLKRALNFVEFTLNKRIDTINDFHEITNLINDILINEKRYGISAIRIYYLTNHVIKNIDRFGEEFEIKGTDYKCFVNYWDLTRWGEVISSKTKREPISFNFKDLSYKVNFLKLNNDISEINTYLGIIPTQLLFDLYSRYNVRLLENNVRVHLQRKNNSEMGKTLINDAEMFVSYNNGISATCKEFKLDSDGTAISIEDLQIVNGGQTTATIYYTKVNRNTRDLCDLTKSFVQIKVTEVPNKKDHEKLVPKISEYSNTQNAIKKSDFYATNPILIYSEKKCKQKFQKRKGAKSNVFYYFERMNGQYNEELKRQGNPNTVARREFEKKFPKELKFDKLDLARWANLIDGFPHIANTGKENSFKKFIDRSKDFKPSEFWLENVIGAGEIFKLARNLYGYSNRKKYPLILGEETDVTLGQSITCFVVSYLSFSTKGLFSFHKVYDFSIDLDEFELILKDLIKVIYKVVLEKGGASAQEQSKSEKMWEYVKFNTPFNKNRLLKYSIPEKEKVRLNSLKETGDQEYFILAEKLLKDNCREVASLTHFLKSNNSFDYTTSKSIERIFKRIQNKEMKITLDNLRTLDNMIIESNKLGFNKVNKVFKIEGYENFSLANKIDNIKDLLEEEDEDIPDL